MIKQLVKRWHMGTHHRRWCGSTRCKRSLFYSVLFCSVSVCFATPTIADMRSYEINSTTNSCQDGISFPDVPKDHWAYNSLKKLSSCQHKKENSTFPHDINQIPLQVAIDGRTYRITSYIWRDFMPISPTSGKGMIASIKLKTQDENPIPSNLIPDKLWVIQREGGEIWETGFSDEPRFSPGTVEMIAREGPKWEPGTKVDVVIRLPSKDNEEIYFLKLPNQEIQRTT